MTLQIEVFSAPGCGKCGQAKVVLRKLVEQLGDDRLEWREINILEKMDYAVALGVLSTPAIAINSKLVFTGLPSEKRLQKELLKRLEADV